MYGLAGKGTITMTDLKSFHILQCLPLNGHGLSLIRSRTSIQNCPEDIMKSPKSTNVNIPSDQHYSQNVKCIVTPLFL